MLPFYNNSHRGATMQRHGYSNGHVAQESPFSPSVTKRRDSDIYGAHTFIPKSQNSLRKRRQLLTRLGIACLLLPILLWLFPDLRAYIFSTITLGGILSGGQELQLETVRYYDLSNVQGTARGWEREERILLCAPLRDAAAHLPMFFSHLKNLTYPHKLIDLAFLVGDSKDNTISLLTELLEDLQDPSHPPSSWYGEISIMEKDFGQVVDQDVESRHGFAAQADRRKSMAQARNWLLSAALRPTHSWVYWRDVDVETAPFTILEDLMRHNKDVIVPNVWRPLPDWLGGEQPYDLNSWQESETALALADTLEEDAVIVEGYAEYATWRPHLAYLRDPYGDPDMEMEIDGVGGVSILAKARVFRMGVHFPAFSFEKHAETEGFGKMAKRMKFSVVGLPHYTIWHLYEPSVDDVHHMEEMEHDRKEKEEKEREERERLVKITEQFDSPKDQWDKDKDNIRNMAKGDTIEEELQKAKAEAAAPPAADHANPAQEAAAPEAAPEAGKGRIIDPLENMQVVGDKPPPPPAEPVLAEAPAQAAEKPPQPAEPAQPVQPVDPVLPAEPVLPVEPAQVAPPAHRAPPAEPVQPAEPDPAAEGRDL